MAADTGPEPGEGGWRWEVALSFAGAQRPYVERVAAALKAAGVRVFYDEDEQTYLWGRYLTEELPKIYADLAATVIVFVSAQYAERDWTRLERRAALNRAVQERREYVLPARFDDTALPGLLSDLVAIDLRSRQPEAFAEIIVGKLDELNIARPVSGPSAGDGLPAGFPEVWNVPARLGMFTGRDDLLAEVAAGLAGGGRVAVAGVTAVHGLGGVGKTQLSIEYAHRHAADYDVVWWVNAQQTALVGEQLAALAAPLGLPVTGVIPDDAAAVRAALARRTGWLVVFDNAESAEQIRPWLPDAPRGGHVLITSRSPVWGGLAVRVTVDVLHRAETVALLSRHIPGVDAATADALAQELGDLPLAVAQAAGYLEQTGATPADYLDRFRRRRAVMLGKGGDLVYGGTVDTAWSLALDQLTVRYPPAAVLLGLAGWLGPEPIPLGLFTDHPDLLPPPMAATVTGTDPGQDLDDVLGVILGFALARRTGNTLVVHRLVQAVIRAHQTPDQASAAADTVGRLLAAHRPGTPDDPGSWDGWAVLGPHLLHATADLDPDDPHQLRSATGWFCWHLYARGDYPAAHTLADHLHRQAGRVLGDDHPDTLNAAHTHARILAALGHHQAARTLAEDTLAHRRRVLGDDHPDTLVSANNLAGRLAALGEHQAAQLLAEDTLTRYRRVLGDDHPDTLHSASNLAVRLADLGEHQAARTLAEDTLARRRRILGDDHPDTLNSAGNLANRLADLGEHQAARTLAEDTLGRRRRILGDDHPDTLNSAGNLAATLANLGEHQAARTLAEDALARNRRVLGDDHPRTRRLEYLIRSLKEPRPRRSGQE
jgi:TIR domain/Tetratricopeptide repeat